MSASWTPSHRRQASLSSHDPFQFVTQPDQPSNSSQTHSIAFVATKLQTISNMKLRSESSLQEPRLRNLLGHISIYDGVREWRQKEIKARFVPGPAPVRHHIRRRSLVPIPVSELQQLLQPMNVVEQVIVDDTPEEIESESQPRPLLQHEHIEPSRTEHIYGSNHIPSFQDFQAAIRTQLATMKEVQRTSKSLQWTSPKDESFDVEEYESEEDTSSDYDSYDGDDAEWRDIEGSDDDDDDDAGSDCSMTDPEIDASDEMDEDERMGCLATEVKLQPPTSLIIGTTHF